MCGEQQTSRLLLPKRRGSPPRVRGTGGHAGDRGGRGGITPACAGNRHRNPPGRLRGRDHPRVCGEQKAVRVLAGMVSGSPPRVRGTVVPISYINLYARITPACAGNRPLLLTYSGGKEDHPRVCGEQLVFWLILLPRAGSPPRVRGTGRSRPTLVELRGITPACAGNRCRRR